MKKFIVFLTFFLLIIDLFLGIKLYKNGKILKKLDIKDKVEISYLSNYRDVDNYFENYDDEKVNSIKYIKNGKEIDKDVLEIGTYDVEIIVKNKTYNSKLTIIDNISPVLKLKTLTIYEGSKYNIDDFIDSCIDEYSECKYDYFSEDMSLYSKVGTYDISIKASDLSGNEIVENTTLTIKKKNIIVSSNLSTNSLKSEAQNLILSNSNDINIVLNGVNGYRSAVGKKNYVLDDSLTLGATIRALEMVYARKFSHIRPNGTSCFTVLKELNYFKTYYGENIASGPSASTALNLWRNSPPHYANMTSSTYKKIGIGKASYNNRTYWVLMFSN